MINFSVGNNEKHQVSFDYRTLTGKVTILLDGKVYQTSSILIVGHTPFILGVGEKEKHEVRIELDNKLFFSLRGSDVSIYVDNNLLQSNHISSPSWMKVVLVMVLLFCGLAIVGGIASIFFPLAK